MDHPTDEVLAINVWEDAQRREHHIPHMEASHIVNCINLLMGHIGDDRFIYEVFYHTRQPIGLAPFEHAKNKSGIPTQSSMRFRDRMNKRFLTMKRFEWELHIRNLAKMTFVSLD